MNQKEFYSLLEEIEKEIDLEGLKIKGIHIWPYIRIKLVNNYHSFSRRNTQAHKRHYKRILSKFFSLPLGLIRYLKYFLRDRNNNDAVNDQRDLVFLTGSSDKRLRLSNGYFDVLIDPIKEYYSKEGITHFTFETAQRFIFNYPRIHKTKPLIFKWIVIYLKSFFEKQKFRPTTEFLESFTKYEKALEKRGLLRLISDKSSVISDVLFIYKVSNYFYNQFQVLKPKIAFLKSYYGFTGMAYCFACYKYGIRSVEIQHGVQGDFHPAYGLFHSLPINGYNTMPNIFLTWTENDKRSIEKWTKKTHSSKVYHIGNLTMNKFLQESDVSLYFDKIINSIFDTSKPKILLSLQPIGLPDIYLRLIEDYSNDYYFLIRLHPGTSNTDRNAFKRKIKKLRSNNFEVENASTLPLYSLLRNTNLHITEYSSVVIEAAAFNVKSIFTAEQGLLYYREYIDNGLAIYCKNYIDLINTINNIDLNKKFKNSYNSHVTDNEEVLRKLYLNEI